MRYKVTIIKEPKSLEDESQDRYNWTQPEGDANDMCIALSDGHLFGGLEMAESVSRWAANVFPYVVGNMEGMQMNGEARMAAPTNKEKSEGDGPPLYSAPTNIDDFVAQLEQKAHERFKEISHPTRDPNAGCTLDACFFSPSGQLHILHVGDGRVYRHRNHQFTQLTTDHAQHTVALEDATSLVHRYNVLKKRWLTSSFGKGQAGPVQYEITDILPGDQYLMITDGLLIRATDTVIHNALMLGFRPYLTAAITHAGVYRKALTDSGWSDKKIESKLAKDKDDCTAILVEVSDE